MFQPVKLRIKSPVNMAVKLVVEWVVKRVVKPEHPAVRRSRRR